MVSRILISPADASDVPAILALIRELAAYESEAVTTTEEDLLRDGFGQQPLFHVLLARAAGEPVGFAFYAFTYSTYRGAPVLFLEDLYVRPDHRRQGIGLALMKALASEAMQRGCSRFAWEVLDWNERAIAFYTSLGAEPKRERLMTWLSGEPLRKLAST
jgi:GNAT superfamily N-acetyltransferase